MKQQIWVKFRHVCEGELLLVWQFEQNDTSLCCRSMLTTTDRDLGIGAILILLAIIVCPLVAVRYVRNVDEAAKGVLQSALKFTQKVGILSGSFCAQMLVT